MRRALTLLAVVGVGCVVAGVYLWLGVAAALITGGVAAAATGLLADDGSKPEVGR